MLPGARDVAAPDGPDEAQRAGATCGTRRSRRLRVRNWGFYGDLSLYDKRGGRLRIPLTATPSRQACKVFFADQGRR